MLIRSLLNHFNLLEIKFGLGQSISLIFICDPCSNSNLVLIKVIYTNFNYHEPMRFFIYGTLYSYSLRSNEDKFFSCTSHRIRRKENIETKAEERVSRLILSLRL